MLNRLLVSSLLSMAVLAMVSCAAPEPPAPAEEEAPPPPPPPPPMVFDIGEVDIVMEEPEFTSRNISFGGVQILDVTNDRLDVLGEQVGETENRPEHYLSYYRNGGLLIYTFKSTGEIRKIEILSRLASQVASPQLRAWLEDGDMEAVRGFMGPEEYDDTGQAQGSTEYVYDARGIRFVSYGDQFGLRFSYYRD